MTQAGQGETVAGRSLSLHTSLSMPFTGSTGPVAYLYGLIGLRKAICESRLGYLYPYAWCAWTVLECSFNVVVVPIRMVYANWQIQSQMELLRLIIIIVNIHSL